MIRPIESVAALRWPLFSHRDPPAAGQSRPSGVASTVLLCLAALLAGSAEADENIAADERFLAGLRQRHLYRLAETYCRTRLEESDLSDERRARLAVERSRTLVEHALESPPEEREELWKRAIDAGNDFARTNPDNAWAVLAAVQEALVLHQRGELAREQAEVVAASEPLMNQARLFLRRSVESLEQISAELDQRLRNLARRRSDRKNSLPDHQISSLKKHVEYQLARAAASQGRSYPPGSPDRAAALQRAVELFGPLVELRTEDALVWRSRLELIACLRLVGDWDAARRRLERLQTAEPPADMASRARAEGIRLALAEGKLDEALNSAELERDTDVTDSGELQLAVLEAYLAAWRDALESGPSPAADRWRSQVQQTVGRIKQTYGGYWFRRAESLLAATLASSASINDLGILVQAAESYYRGGEIDQALATYDRARRRADEISDHRRAFELAYTAATIEHERRNHQQAARRYEEAALATPQHDRAAEAHLLAIYNAGQLVRHEESAEAVADYANLLNEHLCFWPESPSANEARKSLGRLHEHAERWPQAIAAYENVTQDSPQMPAAVEGLARSYEALLAERDRRREPLERSADAAVRYFDQLTAAALHEAPQRAAARLAALASARIRVRFVGSGFDLAEHALREVIDDAQTPSDLNQRAQTWLVAALAGQGKHHRASELLARIGHVPIKELLSMAEALSHLVATDTEAHRQAIAALGIEASKLIERRLDELPASDRRDASLLKARALSAAGERKQALACLGSLMEDFPRDAEILEQCGNLLLESGDRPELESALEIWRELEGHLKPTSERWYRAKYYLAETHFQLGQPEQAEKIIALTQVLHPDLGGPKMRERFLDLLQRCQRLR